MRNVGLIVFTVLLAVGVLTGCSSPGAEGPAAEEIQLTQANDGEQIALEVGQQFMITLEGGAGYTYEVEVEDPEVVTQVGRVSVGEQADRGMLRFEALQQGETTLQIEYNPIGSPNVQTMVLQLLVQ